MGIIKYIGICLLILCMGFGAYADQNVSFSRPKIAQGESVELIFSSDFPISDTPDLNALQSDFIVSGQATQMLSSVVNGTVHKSYQLIYNLFPRKSGVITVDSLKWNGKTLDPVTIVVAPSADRMNTPITMTASLSNSTVYQGESFIYTIKLYDISRVLDGQVTEPRLDGASIRQLGQDDVITQMKNNTPIQVFERQYLIVPQKPGSVRIEPARFMGTMQASVQKSRLPGDLFDLGILFDGFNQMGQSVFAQTQPLQLTVLPQPDDWTGWWLPSPKVTLTQTDEMPPVLKAGSLIKRQITLTAQGVEAEAMPVPVLSSFEGIKVYPEPPVRETQHTGDTITGSVSVLFSIMPTQGGEMTIPAVKVKWFNTKTNQVEWAQIPQQTLMVGGAKLTGQMQAPSSQAQLKEAPLQHQIGPENNLSLTPMASEKSVVRNHIVWLIAGIVGGIFMTGSVYFFIRRKKKGRPKKTKPLPDLYPF